MEKLYITVQNGIKPYINKNGEVVIDLRPQTVNLGRKEITTDGVEYRVVHTYTDKEGEEKYRVGDRGYLKVDKNHALRVSRKTEEKA